MCNELIWVLFAVFTFTSILIAVGIYGKASLYVVVIVGIIICNLQTLKLIELFSFTVTLGNIIYGSIFLATDLLHECYGKKEAQKAVHLGFFSLVFFTITIIFTISFNPSPSDIHHDAMVTLFKISPRVMIASLIAYVVSQYYNVHIFSKLHIITSGKHLWLRNNISTLTSQFLDSIVFTLIAFYNVYEVEVLWSILYTNILFKWLVALLDTPVVYTGRWILSSLKKQASNAAINVTINNTPNATL